MKSSAFDAEVDHRPSDGTPLDPFVGKTLDKRYRVGERIGSGGIGTVYRGEHVTLHKAVAIKVLRSELAQLPEFLKRFDREARAMSRLSHVNIVSVTDFGVSDKVAFIVMELLEGSSLADEIARGRLPVPRAIFLTRQILAALAYAHGMGVVHRDLKPHNVMIVNQPGVRDLIKLLDFGLAKFLTEETGGKQESTLTQAGTVFGTPAYMPPEQAAGSDADPRSDLYSTGVMLFEMVIGKRPFYSDSRADLIRQHLLMPPPIPSAVAPDAHIPRKLEQCILTAMEKSVDKRFASASDFATALDTIDVDGAREGVARSAVYPTLTGSTTVDHTPTSAVPRLSRGVHRSAWSRAIGVVRTVWRFVPTGRWARRLALVAIVAVGLYYGWQWVAGLSIWSSMSAGAREAVDSASRTVGQVGEHVGAGVDKIGGQIGGLLDGPDAGVGRTGRDGPRARPRDPWRGGMPGPLWQSKLALKRNQPERAVNLAKNYITRNNDDARGYLALGHAYYKKIWVRDALLRYQTALRIDSGVRGDPQILDNVVDCLGNRFTYEACGDFLRREYGNEAVGRLSSAVTRSNSFDAAHGAANLLREMGAGSVVDSTAMNIADLRRAKTCAPKRTAFDALRGVRDARVTAALRNLRAADPFTARCLGDRLTEELADRGIRP